MSTQTLSASEALTPAVPARGLSIVALPGLAGIASVGLLVLAFADNAARRGEGYADPLFWLGLVLTVAPIAWRLAAKAPSRAERLWLLVILGAGLYLMKVLHSPSQFTFHDELGHVRSTYDILQTNHLFARNPLVGAYAVYPGSDIVTAALAQISGLSVFTSGLLLVGLVRLALLPALFLLYEEASGSARLAGVAAVIYTANPNYLFFDAQFAYESLALPLALIVLVAAARSSGGGRAGRDVPWLVVATVALGVVVTHHMSTVALVLSLLGLFVAGVIGGTKLRDAVRTRPFTIGALALAAGGGWTVVAGSQTSRELLPVFTETLQALGNLLSGASGPKRPFATRSGATDSLLARLIGLAAVLFLLIGLIRGAHALWRRRPLSPLQTLLGLAAIAYPATLALRITEAGTETSNRASEFVFVGLAYVVALVIAQVPRRRGRARARARSEAPLMSPAIAVAATLLVVGGLVVGWAPYSRLPGPYAPGASSRSIDAQAVAAARWTGENLPARSFAASDEANSTLLTAYGRLDPQRGQVNGVRVATLFVSPVFGAPEAGVVTGDKVRFIVLDRRLSTAPPLSDRYFPGGDPRGFKPPVSAHALAKFDGVPQVDRVFDSGAIQIYDARRVLSERPR